jgi:hypothetical protein
MADYGSLPFAEQIAFFKDKLDLPTERWDDLLGAAHDRAFVVAGATGADLLADLHAAVRKGIEDGTTLAEFRRDFDRIVAARGWTGFTGSDSAEGIAWRTRVIYETNLRTSYAAGRWQQIQAVKADRPYLEYRHSESVLNPRPLHQSWDGLVLLADDPWWQTHYPPNGWGCKCRVFALNDQDLERLGKAEPDRAPDDGVRDWKDSRGVVHQVPNGIDPGWDYAPGAHAQTALRDLFARRVRDLPPELGAAMAARLGPALLAEEVRAFAAWADAVSQPRGDLRQVGALSPKVVEALTAAGRPPASAALTVRDEDVIHTHRDVKADRLPWDWYRELPRHLAAPRAVLLDKTDPDGGLLLVFDLPGGATGKLVVKVDYAVQVRGADGIKRKQTLNIVRTGKVVPREALLDRTTYEPLEGEV